MKRLRMLLSWDLLFVYKVDFRGPAVAPESSDGPPATAFYGTGQGGVLRSADGEKDEDLAGMALLQVAVPENLADFGLNSVLVLGNRAGRPVKLDIHIVALLICLKKVTVYIRKPEAACQRCGEDYISVIAGLQDNF
jgi:hypothetical protein